MKKFRNLFMVLALALVLVFAAKGLGANAETTVDPAHFGSGSGAKVTDWYFDVNTAQLCVEVDDADEAKLYYQVVKNDAAAGADKLKVANWIPAFWGSYWFEEAEKDGEGYIIDLSAYSKEVVVVVTFDPTKTENAGKKTISVPTDKLKLKAKFDTKVVVDVNDPGYGASAESGCSLKDILTGLDSVNLTLQYRRSAGEAWHTEDATNEEARQDLYKEYSMLRASNGTLYVRAYQASSGSGANATLNSFATKEVKVKIPKGAAAPKVKVDYVKGEIAFPKTVQVVYSNSGTPTLGTPDANAGFSTTTTATTAKISVPVDKIVTALNKEAGADVSFQVRTAATEKKYGSYFATIAFKAPAAAPTVTGVYDATAKVVTLSVSGSTTDVKLQYFTDKNKWADVKNNEIKAATKPTTAIKVRIAPVKESKTTAGVFGSKEYAVEIAAEKVKVKLSAAVANGSVKIGTTDVTTGGIEVEKGSNVDILIAAAEGYELEKVMVGSDDKTSSVSGGKLTISAIAADTTITVTFKATSTSSTPNDDTP